MPRELKQFQAIHEALDLCMAADAVTPAMMGWFILYLVMAVLLFGAIFIAIGAACNDLKDSQNMMTPALIFLMVPVFTWAAILRAPDSPLSMALSLFPTATPFLMLLRIALQPGPPLWQVLLSVALMGATTIFVVWAAGRNEWPFAAPERDGPLPS